MKRSRHRGFSMVMAIMCIGLTASALAVCGIMVAGDSRRTLLAAEDSQLRQLLLAAAPVAQNRLKTPWNPMEIVTVNLPQPLSTTGATLTLQPTSAGTNQEMDIDVEAALPHHRAGQTLHFTNKSGAWTLTAAMLN